MGEGALFFFTHLDEDVIGAVLHAADIPVQNILVLNSVITYQITGIYNCF